MVREGETLKRAGTPVKSMKEYVVSGAMRSFFCANGFLSPSHSTSLSDHTDRYSMMGHHIVSGFVGPKSAPGVKSVDGSLQISVASLISVLTL